MDLISFNRTLIMLVLLGIISFVLVSLFTTSQSALSPIALRLPDLNTPLSPAYRQSYPQANIFDENRASWQASARKETDAGGGQIRGFLKAGDVEVLFTDEQYLPKGQQIDQGTFEGIKDGQAILQNGGISAVNPRQKRKEELESLPIHIKPTQGP